MKSRRAHRVVEPAAVWSSAWRDRCILPSCFAAFTARRAGRGLVRRRRVPPADAGSHLRHPSGPADQRVAAAGRQADVAGAADVRHRPARPGWRPRRHGNVLAVVVNITVTEPRAAVSSGVRQRRSRRRAARRSSTSTPNQTVPNLAIVRPGPTASSPSAFTAERHGPRRRRRVRLVLHQHVGGRRRGARLDPDVAARVLDTRRRLNVVRRARRSAAETSPLQIRGVDGSTRQRRRRARRAQRHRRRAQRRRHHRRPAAPPTCPWCPSHYRRRGRRRRTSTCRPGR